MKQLGNLAIVCAQRPEISLQIHGGEVSVHVGETPRCETLHAEWEDDAAITQLIHELNFGRYATIGKEKKNHD
ncbi:MAG: hypothetical protein H6Q60_644 [Oscillospiraceae bacterium]|nr:hypothetical protein [Oscillospiraceae bacterium]